MATNKRMKTAPVYDAIRRFARDQELLEASTDSRAAFLHHITQASNRVDQLFFEGIVDLASQPSDVYLDEVRVAVEVHVPDLLGNHRSGKDIARVPREERQ